MHINLIRFLRSLSFGGSIGSGLILVLYKIYPQLFVAPLGLEYMFIFGGVLGASAHRVFDSLIVKGLLYPVDRFVTFYSRLAQLEMLARRDLIDDKTHSRIREELTVAYFLEKDSDESTRNLFLPK